MKNSRRKQLIKNLLDKNLIMKMKIMLMIIDGWGSRRRWVIHCWGQLDLEIQAHEKIKTGTWRLFDYYSIVPQ